MVPCTMSGIMGWSTSFELAPGGVRDIILNDPRAALENDSNPKVQRALRISGKLVPSTLIFRASLILFVLPLG